MSMRTLKDLGKIVTGNTPKMSERENFDSADIPFIKPGDISDDSITVINKGQFFISENARDKARILPSDSILVTCIGIIGKVGILTREAAFNQQINGIVPDINSVIPRYLAYAILSQKSYLQEKANAAVVPIINKSQFSELKVEVPNLQKQNEIVRNLDKVDHLISLQKQQLKGLDELVKSRFLEMFGMSEGIDKHLEDVADICSGITKGRKVLGLELREVPYMAVSNVKMGYIDLSTIKAIMATENEIEQYRLFPNDILMTEGGDPDKVGRGAIIRNPPKDCIHQNHIFRVRLHKDVLLPEFFEEYLQGNSARRYFLKAAKQTTGIASINMKQLRALPVKIPPIKVQIQYSDFVHQVDKSKLAVQKSLDELEILKKSLMQQYFG